MYPGWDESRQLVRVVESGTGRPLTTVSRAYTHTHHLVRGMKLRPDDVWVVTYPKCGTTWTQEIVWNLMQGVQVGGVSKLTNKQVSEFQIERISEWLFDRSPFIDLPMLKGHTLEEAEQFFAKVEALPSPRTIKVLAIIGLSVCLFCAK